MASKYVHTLVVDLTTALRRPFHLCIFRFSIPSQGKSDPVNYLRSLQLYQLLRPEFSSLLTKDEEMEILVLISRLIQTLSSNKLAIDDKHMPRLYARFLAGLLAQHRREGIANGHLSVSSHNPRPPPEGRSETIRNYSENTIAAAPQAQGQTGNGSNFDNSDRHAETNITNMYGTEPISDDASIPIIIDDDYLLEGNILPEEEFLATMQTIKNPTFWQNMMLPG